jgi:hypothetical protein
MMMAHAIAPSASPSETRRMFEERTAWLRRRALWAAGSIARKGDATKSDATKVPEGSAHFTVARPSNDTLGFTSC